MPPEHDETTEEQTTEEELDKLRAFEVMATGELDVLRPAALRESIRAAGADPDSATGKTIIELSKTIPSLITSPRMVGDKIRELGLPFAEGPAATSKPKPTGDAYLDDPRPRPDLPHWHPMNTPGDPAYKVASRAATIQRSREQEEADKEHDRQRVEERERRNEERAEWGRQPAPNQPTGGLPDPQRTLLNDTSRSHTARIAEAREKGWWHIASQIQLAAEREEAAK